jgi:hypothetical protein
MSEKDNSEEVKFISLDEAASMKSGTRVTFIPGMQALYADRRSVRIGLAIQANTPTR